MPGLPVPSLPLAVPLTSRLQVRGFWIFEKIDGIRAFWDTQSLITRSGAVLPLNLSLSRTHCFDGELFAGSFERTIQALKSGDFSKCHFHIFDFWDSQSQTASFAERFRLLQATAITDPQCSVLPCLGHVKDEDMLDRNLREVVSRGGEGLILRDPGAAVQFRRSEAIVKVKGYFDADGEVLDYVVSKTGKMFGRVAALVVRMDDSGKTIRVGSGLTELDRIQPPPVGARVSVGWKQVSSETGLPKCPFYLKQLSPHSS